MVKNNLFLLFLFIILISFTSSEISNISEMQASDAINQSENIILEFKGNNFSTFFIEDSLIEAKRIFEQAKYAEILRNEANYSIDEVLEAKSALRLVKWKNISFSDVLVYTDLIENRKNTAYLLSDRITVEGKKLDGLTENTKNLFYEAEISFREERYNETADLLDDFRLAYEKEKESSYTLSGLKNSTLNFFQKYWIPILIFLIFLSIIYRPVKNYIEKNILKNKIKKVKAEEKVLSELIKKTQEERFKENSISALVYNIRMKKYDEKLQKIKEELPVFEEKLRKLK